MNFLQAIVLGVVEGLTEFLPVSSTFHLIWAGQLLGLEHSQFQKLFEVFIQAGAVLAVLTLYLKSLLSDRALLKKLILSCIPSAVVGLLFYDLIKSVLFETFSLQLTVFAGVGLLFLLFEHSKLSQNLDREVSDLTNKEALLIGLAQTLAVIPGVSRAGAVILAMMSLKIKRAEAARYSFLLALPTIIGAAGFDLWRSEEVLFQEASYLPLLLLGSLAAFLSALVVVKWFITYLQKHSISIFAWYRLAVVAVLVGTLLFFGSGM